MMSGMTLRDLCKVSGASEAVVRQAVQLGLVRPLWVRLAHARQLTIDPETGSRWAQTYAAALAVRQPAPVPPDEVEEPPVIWQPKVAADRADDDEAKTRPKRNRNRQGRQRIEPVLEALRDGETPWTINELCVLSGASRQTIMNAIHGLHGVLPVVSTSPFLISSKSAEAYIAAREARWFAIKQNKQRKLR